MQPDSPELAAWTEALAEQTTRRARLLASVHAGVRTSVDLERLSARAPQLASPEPFLALRELGEERLAALFLEELLAAACAAPASRVWSALGRAQVSVELEVVGLRAAQRELATCTDRLRRAALAKSVTAALAQVEPDLAEIVERRAEGLNRLSIAAPGLEKPIAEAETLLRETRDAFEELLAYRLRKERIDAGGGGRRADLELCAELLSLREQVNPPLRALAHQVASGVELDPSGGQTIALDLEERPARLLGLHVAAFEVPGELALLLAPSASPADLERILEGQGRALHLAHVDPELDWIDRVGIDPALPLASGWVMSAVLADPGWQRRVLRLPSRLASEAAQAFAFRRLLALRITAARLIVARELRVRGPSEAVRELYRERLSAATGVDYGTSGWLELDLEAESASLRAMGIAAALEAALVEQFNEDHWRNPHSGGFLRELWRAGGAVELAQFVGEKREAGRAARSWIERAAG